jgi:hypothetical protein
MTGNPHVQAEVDHDATVDLSPAEFCRRVEKSL